MLSVKLKEDGKIFVVARRIMDRPLPLQINASATDAAGIGASA
jgi:hypothetical protein